MEKPQITECLRNPNFNEYICKMDTDVELIIRKINKDKDTYGQKSYVKLKLPSDYDLFAEYTTSEYSVKMIAASLRTLADNIEAVQKEVEKINDVLGFMD